MLTPYNMFCSLTNLDIKAPAAHTPEIPSQFPVSAGPLIEQTPRQVIPYSTTSSMDAFTGQSNWNCWNWEEAAPPGRRPLRNVRMLVESFRILLILYSYSCIGGVFTTPQHFRLSNATCALHDPRRYLVHHHSLSAQSTVK